MTFRKLHAVLLVIAVVILHRPAPGQSQPAATAGPRVPVTIALADELPFPGSTYVILRRPAAEPTDGAAPDVIFLTRGFANAQELSNAVRDLLAIRSSTGDTAAVRQVLRLRRDLHTTQGRPPLPWAQRVLNDLHGADQQSVEELGRYPAVRIFLPPQMASARAARD